MVNGKDEIMRADGLSFNYGKGPVLENVDIVLNQGEITAVIGPNGSGKSTLLNILSGLLQSSQGAVCLKGKPLREYSRLELARILGFVPQAPEVALGFSVLETVLAGRYSIMGQRMFENALDLAAAKQALDDTGLTHLENRLAGELSGGERQRLSLARVLAVEPQILLLDEPTSALDLEHQLNIMQLLETGCRDRHLTICLVSHDINLAAMFCDRMLLLHKGRPVVYGRPVDVLCLETLNTVYNVPLSIDREPTRGRPRVTLAPLN